MGGTQRRRVTTLLVAMLVLLVGFATPAQAATNPNPIRWTVYKTLFGPHGEDIPLRYGQADAGPIDGFGTRHIEGNHELWGDWPSTANKIEDVIQGGKCTTSGSTVTCRTGPAYVFVAVYSKRVDSRSRDGRPVGVITFYWYCGTC
jgi:hypothetical protein